MPNIDLRSVLRHTVSEHYDDLVTRHTGRAVRGRVEELLAETDVEQLAIIDFAEVGCLDISCADEIVGKLLLEHGHVRYFVLRGLTAAHCDAISAVLERHSLAAITEDRDGRAHLLGPIESTARDVFAAVSERRQAALPEIADRAAVSADRARRALDVLLERRLVQRDADLYRTPVTG